MGGDLCWTHSADSCRWLGVCTEECPNLLEVSRLHAESAYWRAMHGRAVERGAQATELRITVRRLEAELRAAHERERERLARIEELEAKVRLREQQLFGRKSEQQNKREGAKAGDGAKRSRGQQRGAAGHGRRRYDTLPSVYEDKELPAEERSCPCCGLPFAELAGTEDSDELEVEVRAYRRVYRRKRYVRRCRCPGLPPIVTAPGPAKLIAKGLFGISIWVMVLLDKFLFHRPTHRLLEDWKTRGLDLAQGSLTGGLERLLPLLSPLKEAIIERQRKADHWHADETRWMVFVELEGKLGHRWFLWMMCTSDTVIFDLDPSRSADVPLEHFGDARGIVSADRYCAYKVLAKDGRLLIAYCWAHVRRDFLAIAKSFPHQEAWAMAWVERIREAYRLNDLRVDLWVAENAHVAEQAALEGHMASMKATFNAQLAEPALHTAARKRLESLVNHWPGLLLFVDHPWVPMDNNTAERTVRGPVVGRKNYYGSGSLWSGELAATAFSIFQTLLLGAINPRLWLHAYLQACAEAGGVAPPDFASFLPWHLSPERQQEWAMPGKAPAEVNRGANGQILRPELQRPRTRGDPPDHRSGAEPDPLGDFTASL